MAWKFFSGQYFHGIPKFMFEGPFLVKAIAQITNPSAGALPVETGRPHRNLFQSVKLQGQSKTVRTVVREMILGMAT